MNYSLVHVQYELTGAWDSSTLDTKALDTGSSCELHTDLVILEEFSLRQSIEEHTSGKPGELVPEGVV